MPNTPFPAAPPRRAKRQLGGTIQSDAVAVDAVMAGDPGAPAETLPPESCGMDAAAERASGPLLFARPSDAEPPPAGQSVESDPVLTKSPEPASADADTGATSPGDGYQFEGHVDFFGYSPLAEGWLVGGWMSHPWPAGNRPESAVAHFTGATVDGPAVLTFYVREDVVQRGIGYVIFLHAPSDASGALLELEICFTRSSHRMQPTREVLRLSGPALIGEVEPILSAGEDGSQRRRLLDLLLYGKPLDAVTGIIDFYGYHTAAGGWVFTGWVSAGWPRTHRPEHVVVSFEQGDITGECLAAVYLRPDIDDGSMGVTFLLPGSLAALGSLVTFSFDLGRARCSLLPSVQVVRLRDGELATRARSWLLQGGSGSGAETLLALLARRPFTGEDTLLALKDPVLFEVDELIFCEPDCALLLGWHLAKPGVVRSLRIRCGDLSAPLDLSKAFIVNRPDVVAAFQAQHGFDDPRCGFVAFVPHALTRDGHAYVEIETSRGEIGHRAIVRPKLQGMAAIHHVLERVNVRFGAVPHAYEHVLGPAIEALNRARLATRPPVEVVEYGEPPPLPVYSVIIPLYGRIDYIEYQMALFSARTSNDDVEYIYVLDDPSLQQETKFLCASVYERFGIPIRLLVLERNVGFAPASNIGLIYATGSYVAFLNSDVFPGTLDWLERLSGQLHANPDIGVIGALLLYEDGTVQHQGMEFRTLREFGDWPFGQHTGKGLRYAGTDELRRSISITGACMVMRCALARQIGGFEETYVIGDFEDSDLCLRLHALGYASAVDPTVQLYHLERQSQASAASTWRLNLTVYNAWQHQRRWARTIATYPAGA